jgi:hypothetical protein
LNGGEKVKLGRVMMKIMEVNIESNDDQDSNNTEMSFRDIEPQRPDTDRIGPFADDIGPQRVRSPSVTS